MARAISFFAEPGVISYAWKSPKPSVASFRMISALRTLEVELRTVFDVGANEGQFAGAIRHWYPDAKIISFEPTPATFVRLKANAEKMSNITAEQTAVGARSGHIDFFVNQHSHASSALVVSKEQTAMMPETATTEKISVPVVTLAEYSRGKQWPRPLLLKLDVQGYELQVLQGMGPFIEQVDYLLFECSYRPMYENEPLFGEMYDYVRGLGFEIIAPVGFLEDSAHVLVQTDLLWRRRSAG